jgi:hypothetical protein
MGIFDIFTGQPAIDAAEKNKALLGQTQSNILGTNATTSSQIGSLLQGGYGQGRTDLGTGYGASTGAINAGAAGAQGYLDQGSQGGIAALMANGGAYQPLTDAAGRYGQGAKLYADSLGINGPEGNARRLVPTSRGRAIRQAKRPVWMPLHATPTRRAGLAAIR